ncbi:hypothetical protein [Winogradskyella vincentii]|uniref:O-Antigen ligase n=1 Tax=Winogradskyella vincentii TaxID=2877122 RepID=A0ABS7XZ17_9FLAO|nr:hypothetical protein [Winogradskyella vincentii]MCA0151872.1 hypothetical protein [Winogradskyella vincentii]
MAVYRLNTLIIKILKGYIIIFLCLGWMIDQGILTHNQLLVFQLMPLALFIIVLAKRKGAINSKPKLITVFFPLIVVISGLINNVNTLSMLLDIRWLILPLFVYLTLINLNLKQQELKGLIKFVFILGILHIPMAFLKYFILEWHGETTLGLISHSGSTYFVTIAFAFILSFSSNNSLLRNLILFFGFILVAVSSAKRAIIFMLPIIFVVFLYLNRDNSKNSLRTFNYSFFLLPLFVYLLVRLSPTLNPSNKIWGVFDLEFAIDYALEYESIDRETFNNTTANRLGTTALILNQTFNSPINFIFGYGGDKLSKSYISSSSSKDFTKQVEYGYNGLTWLLYQYGIIASLIWFLFFFRFKKLSEVIMKTTNSTFWISYAKGIYITAIIMSVFQFGYSPEYKNLELISLVYILFAVAYIYQKKYANIN